MKAIPCVVLTRPAGASNRLKARLSRRGCQALACPTLSIETLPAVAADLAVIKQVDLVFFVSGAAVRALGDQLLKLGLSLGSQVQLAAVGQSTAAEIRRVLGRQDVILPHEGHPEDSESLWKVLVSRGELARRVLIVRGQTGRDWLTQQFQQHGCQVSIHVAYCRRQATWKDPLVRRLQALAAADRLPVFVCSSQEGILALVRLVKLHSLYSWCRGGRFVVTHARHQDVLVDQFLFSETEKMTKISVSGVQDDAILRELETICKVLSSN